MWKRCIEKPRKVNVDNSGSLGNVTEESSLFKSHIIKFASIISETSKCPSFCCARKKTKQACGRASRPRCRKVPAGLWKTWATRLSALTEKGYRWASETLSSPILLIYAFIERLMSPWASCYIEHPKNFKLFPLFLSTSFHTLSSAKKKIDRTRQASQNEIVHNFSSKQLHTSATHLFVEKLINRHYSH